MAFVTVVNERNDGKTQVAFTQDAAGQASVLLADPGADYRNELYSVTVTMSAAGTLQFKSGATVLTGAFSLPASVPYTFESNDPDTPWLEGVESEDLNIVTTVGLAVGVCLVKTVPN